jgi:formylglycine-generating enzyme required for sulfatase activity
VKITKDFEMGKYEVTQAQWKSIMGSNPSRFKGDDLPVEQVSWEDVQQFIQKLNSKSSRYIYRLPTEAEWEYACRAGTTGDYAGDLDSMAWYGLEKANETTHPVGQKKPNAWGLYDMHGNVWEWCQDWYGDKYYASSPSANPRGPKKNLQSSPSGSFPRTPNPPDYPQTHEKDSGRVFRGGAWGNGASSCRSASRDSFEPGIRSSYLGLRLLRTAQ